MSQRVYVWDLPTRLFHWLLVALVIAAYLTQEFDAMEWHQRVGLSLLGLLVFRLAWGVIGSRHARFASFLQGPATVRAYLRGEWQGLGHSPLGGWSVLLLLALPLMLVGTGLFANDDVAFKGLLADWVDKAVSDRLTGLHHLAFNLLLGLVALHVAAIVYYRLVRRQDLLRPMVTGWKQAKADADTHRPEGFRGRWPAFILAGTLAGAVVYGVLAFTPEPPDPVPVQTLPSW
ncbi:MAG: cytochrome b/b6 domain-containing protein [Pseudomonadota bacterium]